MNVLSSHAPGAPCVIALVHGDVEGDEEWVLRLEHCASVVVDVSSLQTGQSSEVEGRVRVCRRRQRRRESGKNDGRLGGSMHALGVVEQCYAVTGDGGVQFMRQLAPQHSVRRV